MPVKPGTMPPLRKDKPLMKKAPSPPAPGGPQGRPPKPFPEAGKPPPNPREPGGSGGGGPVRAPPPREQGKPPNLREGRPKEKQPRPPRRYVAHLVSIYWKADFTLVQDVCIKLSVKRNGLCRWIWLNREHLAKKIILFLTLLIYLISDIAPPSGQISLIFII